MSGDADYRLLGQGPDPTLVVAGGPLLDAGYLGDLGGLSTRRPLAVPTLPRAPVAEVAAALDVVRERLGHASVDVVAHSAGAAAALCLLAQHPDRVRRLVLITPAVGVLAIGADEDGVAAVLESRRAESGFATAIDASQQDPGSLKAQRVSFGAWGDAQIRLAGTSLVERAERLSTYYADPRPDPASLRTAAQDFRGPVTIVRGGVDVHPTRRQAEDLADCFPRAEVVTVPGAGHYPWLDDPGGLVDAVLAGLGRR